MLYIHRAKKLYEGGGKNYNGYVAPSAETVGESASYAEAARFIRTLPTGWTYYVSNRPRKNWRKT